MGSPGGVQPRGPLEHGWSVQRPEPEPQPPVQKETWLSKVVTYIKDRSIMGMVYKKASDVSHSIFSKGAEIKLYKDPNLWYQSQSIIEGRTPYQEQFESSTPFVASKEEIEESILDTQKAEAKLTQGDVYSAEEGYVFRDSSFREIWRLNGSTLDVTREDTLSPGNMRYEGVILDEQGMINPETEVKGEGNTGKYIYEYRGTLQPNGTPLNGLLEVHVSSKRAESDLTLVYKGGLPPTGTEFINGRIFIPDVK